MPCRATKVFAKKTKNKNKEVSCTKNALLTKKDSTQNQPNSYPKTTPFFCPKIGNKATQEPKNIMIPKLHFPNIFETMLEYHMVDEHDGVRLKGGSRKVARRRSLTSQPSNSSSYYCQTPPSNPTLATIPPHSPPPSSSLPLAVPLSHSS